MRKRTVLLQAVSRSLFATLHHVIRSFLFFTSVIVRTPFGARFSSLRVIHVDGHTGWFSILLKPFLVRYSAILSGLVLGVIQQCRLIFLLRALSVSIASTPLTLSGWRFMRRIGLQVGKPISVTHQDTSRPMYASLFGQAWVSGVMAYMFSSMSLHKAGSDRSVKISDTLFSSS